MFNENTTQDVCPVLGPSTLQDDAVIEPEITIPHIHGMFFTSPDLNSSLFRVSHIHRPCRQEPQTGDCDQLLIRRIGMIRDLGNFSFRYIPHGNSQAIQLRVFYGKSSPHPQLLFQYSKLFVFQVQLD